MIKIAIKGCSFDVIIPDMGWNWEGGGVKETRSNRIAPDDLTAHC